MTVEILARIEGVHKSGSPFGVGIVLYDDVVVEAGPIVGFMKGWKRAKVRAYCKDRNWDVEIITQSTRHDIDSKGRAITKR